MEVCNIFDINFDNFKDNDIVINDVCIVLDNKEIASNSRYGFRKNELLKLVGNGNKCTVYNTKNKTLLKINDDFKTYNGIFTIGICSGRPMCNSIDRLKELGFNPKFESEHPRDIRINSNDYLKNNDVFYKIEYLLVKSYDIPNMLKNNIIDAIICYSDIWYNLDESDYNIKYISYFSDELGNKDTYISMVCNPSHKLHKSGQLYINNEFTHYNKKIKIFGEYKDSERLIKKYSNYLGFIDDQAEITQVSGGVESYVKKGLCDFGITIVQSGETLKTNEMVEYFKLRKVFLNLWMYIPPRINMTNNLKLDLRRELYMTLKNKDEQRYLIIDGIDGTGKTTLLKKLARDKRIHNVICYDRHKIITDATLSLKSIPEGGSIYNDIFTRENTTVIILESELLTCDERITTRNDVKKYEKIGAQCYFRLRYRQLAALYGYNILNNDGTMDELVENTFKILDGDETFKVPNLKLMTDEYFNLLKPVAEGESKIVRSFNERFDIVRYKPSVYSHKRQRGGTVKGTDLERQKTTMNIMLLLAKENIEHTYWCIYNGFILAEKVKPPSVEVCVKGAHVGTHKHIYYDMCNKTDRFGNKLTSSNDMYPEPIVRFDWRNPNHILPSDNEKLIDMKHTQIFVNPLRESGKTDEEINNILNDMFPHGVPLGDYAMCDSLADRFIDVNKTKLLVTKAFKALSYHFAMINIRFKDVCFMPTTDGKKLYGEVSQDCGRYEAIDPSITAFQKCLETKIPWDDESTSLDKDIWRSGGTSELVLEKWKRLTFLIDNYTQSHLKEWINEIFMN